jgi:hypothetical protein
MSDDITIKVKNIASPEKQPDLNKVENTLEMPRSAEKPVYSPEQEKGFENRENKIEKILSEEGNKGPEVAGNAKGGIIPATNYNQQMAQRQKKIEKIMEAGLEDIYKQLPPKKQFEFRSVGETTAREINNILTKAKFKMITIVELVIKWLSIIPGLNKFFIEQEAKLKVDEIIKMKDSEK